MQSGGILVVKPLAPRSTSTVERIVDIRVDDTRNPFVESRRLLNITQGAPGRHTTRAEELSKAGRHAEAIAEQKKAIDIQPHHDRWLYALAAVANLKIVPVDGGLRCWICPGAGARLPLEKRWQCRNLPATRQWGVESVQRASRCAESLLFGLTATDPFTIALSMFGLAVIGACASVIPAWRAARVEPTTALRE